MRSKKTAGDLRNSQVVRVLSIIRDLTRLGGVDVYELAAKYGTSERTIRRDLDAILAMRLPLVEEHDGKKKRWRLDFKGDLARLAELLDVSHYLSLRMAMDQGAKTAVPSPVFASLEDLANKIELALGKKAREDLTAIERCFHSYEKQAYRDAPVDIIYPLLKAITDNRLCRVTYQAPHVKPKQKTFTILPLKLFHYRGAIYLMAYMPFYKNYMNLNLHRMKAVTLTSKNLETPKDFDPEKLENAAFGVHHTGRPVTYKLRFAPWVAPFIRERIWHPSQTLEDTKDGGVVLTFRCAKTYEVKAWVASWLDGVTVLAPKSLKDEMADLGEWLVGQYVR